MIINARRMDTEIQLIGNGLFPARTFACQTIPHEISFEISKIKSLCFVTLYKLLYLGLYHWD